MHFQKCATGQILGQYNIKNNIQFKLRPAMLLENILRMNCSLDHATLRLKTLQQLPFAPEVKSHLLTVASGLASVHPSQDSSGPFTHSALATLAFFQFPRHCKLSCLQGFCTDCALSHQGLCPNSHFFTLRGLLFLTLQVLA